MDFVILQHFFLFKVHFPFVLYPPPHPTLRLLKRLARRCGRQTLGPADPGGHFGSSVDASHLRAYAKVLVFQRLSWPSKSDFQAAGETWLRFPRYGQRRGYFRGLREKDVPFSRLLK